MKTPIEYALDKVDFKPVEVVRTEGSNLPYVTHEGVLRIAEISIKVYVLNTGERIIPEDELNKFFGNHLK